jgi:dTDP-4-amino-4,6-dideoxygalactose transaminase
MGADPIIVDVEYASGLLQPSGLAEALAKHPKAKGVIAVHFAGHPAELVNDTNSGILDICRKYGIFLIEDAAHSFPTRLKGKQIGSFGDATCFSFYANKTITTGEGGMLTTNDPELFKRTKLMRLHGIDRDVWDRFTNRKASWEYDVVAPGFKYNLPDLNAAVGLAQLERVEDLRAARQKCAAVYLNRLGQHELLDVIHPKVPMEDHAWHLFPIYLKSGVTLSRNEVIDRINARGIATSVHYKPLHRLKYYRETYNLQETDYPVAERMWKSCLTLPLFAGLTDDEVNYVCDTVLEVVAGR